MKQVGLKKLLIYKNHIFPETKKPLSSITQFLISKSPQLDRMKAKKMSQLLDEDEKKRLKSQRQLLNEKISYDLDLYYRDYIEPFEQCPDYFVMLFRYALTKARLFVDGSFQKNGILRSASGKKNQEPFYMTRKQIREVLKLSSNDKQIGNSKNKISKKIISQNLKQESLPFNNNTNQNQIYEGRSVGQNKMAYQVYRCLYPSQKAIVYKMFMQEYGKFLIQKQFIIKQILDQRVTYLKPFLVQSPLELYQSKRNELSLRESEQILCQESGQRQKIEKQFVGTLEARYQQIWTIKARHKINDRQLWAEYRKQYYNRDKYESFYSMIKFK